MLCAELVLILGYDAKVEEAIGFNDDGNFKTTTLFCSLDLVDPLTRLGIDDFLVPQSGNVSMAQCLTNVTLILMVTGQ
jgi:hypothetical protein